MAERKPKAEAPLPPLRCFTYAASDVPGSYVRVHGREPKTKKDRDALLSIIMAARSMLGDRDNWRARAVVAEKKLEEVAAILDSDVNVIEGINAIRARLSLAAATNGSTP